MAFPTQITSGIPTTRTSYEVPTHSENKFSSKNTEVLTSRRKTRLEEEEQGLKALKLQNLQREKGGLLGSVLSQIEQTL